MDATTSSSFGETALCLHVALWYHGLYKDKLEERFSGRVLAPGRGSNSRVWGLEIYC